MMPDSQGHPPGTGGGRQEGNSSVLSRSQVIHQAQDLGVERAEELLGAASAAWRLRACRGQEVAAAVVGGHPLYLDDGEWPVSEHGVRLSLIVGIDCARLSPLRFDWPPAPDWEHRGARLDIFADRDFGDPTVSVVQRPAQDGLSDLEAGVACAAVPCISLPTLPDEVFDDDFDAREAYEQWRRLVAYDKRTARFGRGHQHAPWLTALDS
jgi:hypothetical protein